MLIHGVKFNIDAPPIGHINSIGGDIIPALSMVDTIRNSKVSVHTIIEGECMSAATLISCVGKKRLMRRNSVVLIHQMRTSYWGKLDECKEDMKNNKKLTTILKDIYITNTNGNELFGKNVKEGYLHHIWEMSQSWNYRWNNVVIYLFCVNSLLSNFILFISSFGDKNSDTISVSSSTCIGFFFNNSWIVLIISSGVSSLELMVLPTQLKR